MISFNDTLTNNIVSFEQLGPDILVHLSTRPKLWWTQFAYLVTHLTAGWIVNSVRIVWRLIRIYTVYTGLNGHLKMVPETMRNDVYFEN